MAVIARCVVLAMLAGCREEPAPPAPVHEARPADAATPAVAPSDAARPCTVEPFSFGVFTLPPGWCWRRTAEGDDLSGELRDQAGVARMTYQQLAHGTRVDDVCRPRPERTSERTETIAGIRVHACVLANGHACYAFPQANLCTTDAAFDADALVRTLKKP